MRSVKPAVIGAVSLGGLMLAISLVVGWRQWVPGSDSYYYEGFFIRLLSGDRGGRYEVGFYYLTVLASWLTSDVRVYFSLICAIFLALYSYFVWSFAVNEGRRNEYIGWLCCTIGALLWSSWFVVAVTNGLRQGLALAFSFIALSMILRRQWLGWVVFSVLSIGFHKSAALVVVSSLLLLASPSAIRAVTLVACISYFLGLSELIFKPFVDAFGLGDSFGLDFAENVADPWYGFSWIVFGYSVGWWVIIYLFSLGCRTKRFGFVGGEQVISVYSVLLLPYFALGFAAYSNRYAYMAWLLLPFAQARMLWGMPLSRAMKVVASILVLFSGFCFFVYKLHFS